MTDNEAWSYGNSNSILEEGVKPAAYHMVSNQLVRPLTLEDVVCYCGNDNDLTATNVLNMLQFNYTESYPVMLMSANDSSQIAYLNKTTHKLEWNSGEASMIYPVAYFDLNFLTSDPTSLGWSLQSREASHKYVISYDTTSALTSTGNMIGSADEYNNEIPY